MRPEPDKLVSDANLIQFAHLTAPILSLACIYGMTEEEACRRAVML